MMAFMIQETVESRTIVLSWRLVIAGLACLCVAGILVVGIVIAVVLWTRRK
jgi:hypothetical protein